MILKIGSGEQEQQFRVHFHREYAETDEQRAAKDPPEPPLLWTVVVTCAIHTGPCVLTARTPKYCINGNVGTSKCSKKDQFVRATGAKTALARAMRHLSPEVRKLIWEAYWQRTRRPKETSAAFKKRLEAVTPVEPLVQATKANPARRVPALPSPATYLGL